MTVLQEYNDLLRRRERLERLKATPLPYGTWERECAARELAREKSDYETRVKSYNRRQNEAAAREKALAATQARQRDAERVRRAREAANDQRAATMRKAARNELARDLQASLSVLTDKVISTCWQHGRGADVERLRSLRSDGNWTALDGEIIRLSKAMGPSIHAFSHLVAKAAIAKGYRGTARTIVTRLLDGSDELAILHAVRDACELITE
jgi:hypothetical protein